MRCEKVVSEVGFVWVDGLGRVIGFTPEQEYSFSGVK
jgi:hypothetical protein